MLDKDAATLHIVLHIVSRFFKRAHAHTQVLGGDHDLAGAKVNTRARHRHVLHQTMILRHFAILEHQFAVVHKAPAQRLIAARDGQALGAARHQKTRCAFAHARARQRGGVDHVELGVVAVGNKLLAAVDHPALAFLHRLGVHHRFGHVIRQPAIRGAARLSQRVRKQEGWVFGDLRKPVFLQVTWRHIRQ